MRHYRKLSTLVLGTTILMLAACDSYSSLRPLYTDDDLVFNAELLGAWGTKDSTESIEFARADQASHGTNAYKVTLLDSNSDKTEENIAHLVKLGDRTFLDVLPGEPHTDSTDNLLAVHTFFLISHIGSTMEIAGLRSKWLADFVAQNPEAIRFEKVGERLILTATTKELQQFLMSHLNDNEAFEPFEELQRKPIM